MALIRRINIPIERGIESYSLYFLLTALIALYSSDHYCLIAK